MKIKDSPGLAGTSKFLTIFCRRIILEPAIGVTEPSDTAIVAELEDSLYALPRLFRTLLLGERAGAQGALYAARSTIFIGKRPSHTGTDRPSAHVASP